MNLVGFIIRTYHDVRSPVRQIRQCQTGKGNIIRTYQYRNTKEKLYKTNAAMWYNKASKVNKQLTPNCTSIKMNGKNSQCRKTIKAATHYRLNQELNSCTFKKLASCQQTSMTNRPTIAACTVKNS